MNNIVDTLVNYTRISTAKETTVSNDNNISIQEEEENNFQLPIENMPQFDNSSISDGDELSLVDQYLSVRNNKGVYDFPNWKDKVLLKVNLQKQMLLDSDINYVIDKNFTYFIEEINVISPSILIPDGYVFRIANEGIKDIEDYTYYIIKDGIINQLPNFKSVVVELSIRNMTTMDIRIIEPNEFESMNKYLNTQKLVNQLIDQGYSENEASEMATRAANNGEIDNSINQSEDLSDSYFDGMDAMVSSLSTFAELASTSSTGASIAASISQQAAANVAAVQAQAQQAQAEAQAAQAQAAQAQAEAELLTNDQVDQLNNIDDRLTVVEQVVNG